MGKHNRKALFLGRPIIHLRFPALNTGCMCIFSLRFYWFIGFVHLIGLGLSVLTGRGLLLCIGFKSHLNKQLQSNWKSA